MMTYLEIMQAVAIHAGVEQITSISATDPDHVLFGRLINAAGDEAARRVDWGALRRVATISGVGVQVPFQIAGDYARLASGLAVTAGLSPVRGSLTSDEWAALPQTMGEPRYFYLSGDQIAFYPYLRSAAEASVSYLSRLWVAGDKAKLSLAGDTPVIPDALLVSGATWRWRRHVGKDFSDHLAEFEAQLADFSRFDGGVRQP